MNVWKCIDRVLNPFSWVVVGVQVAYAIVRGIWPEAIPVGVNAWAGRFMPVLLAGAVGYITNWIALWFLFRPYEPHLGGLWYGIIPRQKNKMAVSMGMMVGKKLLNPDAIVAELESEVMAFVKDGERLAKLRDALQKFLLEHEEEIVDFALPHIESQVAEIIDSLATDDTWCTIWDEGILPRIVREDSRKFIVDKLVEGIRENAGGIIEEVRIELRAYLMKKLDIPLVPTTLIVNTVMNNFADSASMKKKLFDWLGRESTHELLKSKLLDYANQLTVWMKGEEGKRIMSGLVRELKARGKRFLRGYLREKVPVFIDRAFSSEKLSGGLEKKILPMAGNHLAKLIADNKQSILDRLRIEERVTKAVNEMSVRDFHKTLDEFMSENFCAIQVMGFAFGALAGVLLLFIP